MKTQNFIFIVLIALGFVFASCGGGGGGNSSPSTPASTPTTITGVFLDDPVEGLGYECSSGTIGITSAKGEYTCKIDDNVTFMLGNVTLGETYSSSVITPYTLFPSDKDAATNLVRLLHSIDENSSIGQILIGKNFILPTDLNFSSPTFDSDISSSIVKPLMSVEDAMLLLDDNLGRKSGTEIYHNGYWYNTMTSSVTGRIWLDRDLGAKAVCSDYNDTACYGEFYQWGRDTDGHEKRDSLLSYDYPIDIDNAGNKFVIDTLDWIGYDADGTMRESKWGNLEGESVCPVNFRVPTQQEFKDENILVANFTLTNENTQEETVTNVLKLATAGERDLDRGIVREGEIGTYWTGESYKRVVGGAWQYSFFPYSKYGPFKDIGYEGTRAIGKNVRCIMDEEIVHNNVTYSILKSPYTGRIWLDRNLGASRACLNTTDSSCYGDYYQWGGETSDSGGVLRIQEWKKADGSSVCPIGFRVPTMKEILADTAEPGWVIIAHNPSVQHVPYAEFLKLPYAGYHYPNSSEGQYINQLGTLWSTSYSEQDDRYIAYFEYFDYGANTMMMPLPTVRMNVRCIKN